MKNDTWRDLAFAIGAFSLTVLLVLKLVEAGNYTNCVKYNPDKAECLEIIK